MALFKVAIRQALAPALVTIRKWSNTFQLNASNGTEAAEFGIDLWENYLRNAVRTMVFAYEVYATDVGPDGAGTPGTQNFASLPVPQASQRGTIAWNSATESLYWRDVCLQVELMVPNSRPDRKYWRPGLVESDFDQNGTWSSGGLVTAIEDRFNTITTLGLVLDGDGSTFSGAQVSKVGSRRLGRESGFDLPPAPPLAS